MSINYICNVNRLIKEKNKKKTIRFTLCMFLLPFLLPTTLGTLGISSRVVEPLLICGYDEVVESLIELRYDVTPRVRG